MGSKCKILFSEPPKGTTLPETTLFDVFTYRQILGLPRYLSNVSTYKLQMKCPVANIGKLGQRERDLGHVIYYRI